MKKSNDFEIGNSNNYLRSSRNKSDDNPIISKITDYQTSISAFSTRIESKQNLNLSVELKEKRNKTQQKKKVEFNPFITVINIQSYKKDNFCGPSGSDIKESEKEKKCVLCNII